MYVVLVDFRRAYDYVSRDYLLAKLLKLTKIPRKYIVWLAKLLRLSSINLDGEILRTTRSCP